MESNKEIKKRLIPVHIDYDYEENIWRMKPEGEYSCMSFKASEDQVKKLLKRMRAKDSMTSPCSRKKRTYQMMIDGIKNDSYQTIYSWSSKVPKDLDTLKSLIKE